MLVTIVFLAWESELLWIKKYNALLATKPVSEEECKQFAHKKNEYLEAHLSLAKSHSEITPDEIKQKYMSALSNLVTLVCEPISNYESLIVQLENQPPKRDDHLLFTPDLKQSYLKAIEFKAFTLRSSEFTDNPKTVFDHSVLTKQAAEEKFETHKLYYHDRYLQILKEEYAILRDKTSEQTEQEEELIQETQQQHQTIGELRKTLLQAEKTLSAILHRLHPQSSSPRRKSNDSLQQPLPPPPPAFTPTTPATTSDLTINPSFQLGATQPASPISPAKIAHSKAHLRKTTPLEATHLPLKSPPPVLRDKQQLLEYYSNKLFPTDSSSAQASSTLSEVKSRLQSIEEWELKLDKKAKTIAAMKHSITDLTDYSHLQKELIQRLTFKVKQLEELDEQIILIDESRKPSLNNERPVASQASISEHFSPAIHLTPARQDLSPSSTLSAAAACPSSPQKLLAQELAKKLKERRAVFVSKESIPDLSKMANKALEYEEENRKKQLEEAKKQRVLDKYNERALKLPVEPDQTLKAKIHNLKLTLQEISEHNTIQSLQTHVSRLSKKGGANSSPSQLGTNVIKISVSPPSLFSDTHTPTCPNLDTLTHNQHQDLLLNNDILKQVMKEVLITPLSKPVILDLNSLSLYYKQKQEDIHHKKLSCRDAQQYRSELDNFYKAAINIRLSNKSPEEQRDQLRHAAQVHLHNRDKGRRFFADVMMMIGGLIIVGVIIGLVRRSNGHSFFFSQEPTEREQTFNQLLNKTIDNDRLFIDQNVVEVLS